MGKGTRTYEIESRRLFLESTAYTMVSKGDWRGKGNKCILHNPVQETREREACMQCFSNLIASFGSLILAPKGWDSVVVKTSFEMVEAT